MTDVMISAPRRPETEVTEKASRRRFGTEGCRSTTSVGALLGPAAN